MRTPEEIEAERKADNRRDRIVFYLGMIAGASLMLAMILINRV